MIQGLTVEAEMDPSLTKAQSVKRIYYQIDGLKKVHRFYSKIIIGLDH